MFGDHEVMVSLQCCVWLGGCGERPTTVPEPALAQRVLAHMGRSALLRHLLPWLAGGPSIPSVHSCRPKT